MLSDTTPPTADAEADDAFLDEVRARYPDWEITRVPGGFRAVHRREERDYGREAACIYTEVTATWPDQLSARLFVQEELRCGQAMDRIPAQRGASR